jgi:hypothetical protein
VGIGDQHGRREDIEGSGAVTALLRSSGKPAGERGDLN